MIVPASMLHLLITASLVAPVPVDPSACAADDLRCTGRANAEAARLAGSNEQRVRYLYFAHRAYLGLANKGPQSQRERDLCRAHELIEEARKLPATAINARVVDSGVQTQSKIAAAGVDCRKVKMARRRVAPLVAGTAPVRSREEAVARATPGPARPSEETTDPPAARPTPDPVRSPEEAAEPPPLLTTSRGAAGDEVASGESSSERAGEITSTQRPTASVAAGEPLAPSRRVAPPGRRLLIGGGATLAVGMVLGGVAAYTGARAIRVRKDGWVLSDMDGTSEVLTRDMGLRAKYEGLATTAIVTGVAGAAAITAAIVMFVVGARRKGRAAEHEPILMPVVGGLLFTAKF